MQPLEWHTEKRKVKELIPWERNPRQMTERQAKDLQTSLEKFNLMSIPVINSDNILISGHQRVNILKALKRGEEVIDVRVPNRSLTEKEIEEANIRENKNLGEWDFDLLTNFDEEMLKDIGFTDLDFGKIVFENIEEEGKQAKKVIILKLNIPPRVWLTNEKEIMAELQKLSADYGIEIVDGK